MALNALVWLSAAVTYAFYFWSLGSSQKAIIGAFSLNLQVGLVSVTVAFFVIEFFMQRRMIPHFFPHGGMSAVSKTIRIRIRTRLIAFLAAINLFPCLPWHGAARTFPRRLPIPARRCRRCRP